MFSKGVVLVFLILGLSSSIAHAIPHQNRGQDDNPCTGTKTGNNLSDASKSNVTDDSSNKANDVSKSGNDTTTGNNPGKGNGGKGNGKGNDTTLTGNNDKNNTNTQPADIKNNNNTKNNNSSDPKSSLCLDSSTINTASELDGLQSDAKPEPGTAPSETSTNNFINNCVNEVLTNGTQNPKGSCNPIPMGQIPSSDNMPSTKFVFPTNNANITPNTNFTMTLGIKNLQAGSFTNANTNYFAAPQQINKNGVIIGHTHLVVQDVGSIDSTNIPDPKVFAFFKGVNDAADNKGTVSVVLAGGLPAGSYRFCSITTSSNHVPCAVSIAQHGNLDDCVYATVGGNGKNAADNSNNNNSSGNANTTTTGKGDKNATDSANNDNNKDANSGDANSKGAGKGKTGDDTSTNSTTTSNDKSGDTASKSANNKSDKTTGKASGAEASPASSPSPSPDKGGKGQGNNGKGQSTLNKRRPFSLEYRKD